MNVNSFNSIPPDSAQQVMGTVDSCSDSAADSVVDKTYTLTVIPNESDIVETGASVHVQWVCTGIIFIVILVSAYFFYKQIKVLKDDNLRIKKMSREQNSVIASQNMAIESLRNRITDVEQKTIKSITAVTASITKKEESGNIGIDIKTPTSIKPIYSDYVNKSKSNTVKYATLQAPDANGTLRFAERSMTDEVTDQKMFEVELDTVNGTGTYRVNLRAMPMLMSDLQQLRDFVEPFATNTGSSAKRIINDKSGKIHRDGKFWIVDELAVIKLV